MNAIDTLQMIALFILISTLLGLIVAVRANARLLHERIAEIERRDREAAEQRALVRELEAEFRKSMRGRG